MYSSTNIRNIFSNKLSSDIVWNVLSLFFIGLGGFLANTIIMIYYTPDILGVFNQVYAIYIVLSQIAVFGIHFSVLKYSSEHFNKQAHIDHIISSGLLIVTAISILLILVAYICVNIIGSFWTGNVIIGLKYVLPALLFFSLNKLILFFLNGIREMKAFAVFQVLRYMFLLISLLVLSFSKTDGVYLSLCFVYSEFTLFIVLLIFLLKNKFFTFDYNYKWLKEHLKFGKSIFLGNLVVDLNTRIDVIILGIFLSDYFVGIYSYALIFAEGFYQILIAVRKNMNPLITQYLCNNDHVRFEKLFISVKKYSAFLLPIAAVIVLIGYYILCRVLNNTEYLKGVIPLGILLTSMTITGMPIIFGNMLSQTGHPFQETKLNILTVSVNALFNFALIPLLALEGAAIATGFSYIAFSFFLIALSRRVIGVNLNLLFNKISGK